jgi:hypothetical protein
MNRSTRTEKLWMTAVMLCVLSLSVTGCAEPDPVSQVRSFLAMERGPEDVLPPSYPEMAGLDLESSRQVGVLRGIRYFVAAYEAAGACLILVDSKTEASGSACGSNVRGLWAISSALGGAKIVTASDDVPKGWVKLSDFLIVNPDATNT